MKKVYLVRHGKSSWLSETEVEDIDRPLKPKGVLQVVATGKKLRRKDIYPDLIVSSPAMRSLHTALILARELDYPLDRIRIRPELYGSDVSGIQQVLKHAKEDFESVMIFGHDPSLTNFANRCTKKSKEKIPTASVVGIELKCDAWADVIDAKGKQLFFIKPQLDK